MVFVHCAGGLVGIKLIVMSKLNLFVHGIGSSGKERVFVGVGGGGGGELAKS